MDDTGNETKEMDPMKTRTPKKAEPVVVQKPVRARARAPEPVIEDDEDVAPPDDEIEVQAAAPEAPDDVSEEEFARLQEEALEHDVSIWVGNAEVPYHELLPRVAAAKEAELKAHAQAMADRAARLAQEALEAEQAEQAKADELKALQRRTGPITPAKRAVIRRQLPTAPAHLMKGLGLPEPTDADYELAFRYGYPVVIPGAKAYRTRISIHDPMGGGEREAGSVILMIDAHTANKREYLEPLT